MARLPTLVRRGAHKLRSPGALYAAKVAAVVTAVASAAWDGTFDHLVDRACILPVIIVIEVVLISKSLGGVVRGSVLLTVGGVLGSVVGALCGAVYSSGSQSSGWLALSYLLALGAFVVASLGFIEPAVLFSSIGFDIGVIFTFLGVVNNDHAPSELAVNFSKLLLLAAVFAIGIAWLPPQARRGKNEVFNGIADVFECHAILLGDIAVMVDAIVSLPDDTSSLEDVSATARAALLDARVPGADLASFRSLAERTVATIHSGAADAQYESALVDGSVWCDATSILWRQIAADAAQLLRSATDAAAVLSDALDSSASDRTSTAGSESANDDTRPGAESVDSVCGTSIDTLSELEHGGSLQGAKMKSHPRSALSELCMARQRERAVGTPEFLALVRDAGPWLVMALRAGATVAQATAAVARAEASSFAAALAMPLPKAVAQAARLQCAAASEKLSAALVAAHSAQQKALSEVRIKYEVLLRTQQRPLTTGSVAADFVLQCAGMAAGSGLSDVCERCARACTSAAALYKPFVCAKRMFHGAVVALKEPIRTILSFAAHAPAFIRSRLLRRGGGDVFESPLQAFHFLVRLNAGVALLLLPTLFQTYREFFVQWHGAWSLFAFLLIELRTVEGTMVRGIFRLTGTLFACALGFFVSEVARGNAAVLIPLLVIVTWILVLPSSNPQFSYVSGVSALTLHVVAACAPPGGDPSAGKLASARAVQNTMGIVVGILLSVVLFPITTEEAVQWALRSLGSDLGRGVRALVGANLPPRSGNNVLHHRNATSQYVHRDTQEEDTECGQRSWKDDEPDASPVASPRLGAQRSASGNGTPRPLEWNGSSTESAAQIAAPMARPTASAENSDSSEESSLVGTPRARDIDNGFGGASVGTRRGHSFLVGAVPEDASGALANAAARLERARGRIGEAAALPALIGFLPHCVRPQRFFSDPALLARAALAAERTIENVRGAAVLLARAPVLSGTSRAPGLGAPLALVCATGQASDAHIADVGTYLDVLGGEVANGIAEGVNLAAAGDVAALKPLTAAAEALDGADEQVRALVTQFMRLTAPDDVPVDDVRRVFSFLWQAKNVIDAAVVLLGEAKSLRDRISSQKNAARK